MKSRVILFILFTAIFANAHAQRIFHKIEILTTAPISSIRGLSVPSDEVIWVSGTQGKAGRSVDGGKNWEWFSIPGCDSCDFRDIEAFSADRAVIMGIAEPARIFLTEDGGKNWKQVYFNDTKGIFLDAMDFWNEKEGVIVGDAINGRFKGLRTKDGGLSWQDLDMPEAAEGEACFAASGTTLRALPKKNTFAIASGGVKSRFFRYSGSQWAATEWPATQGIASTGIFSFAFYGTKNGVAVGGDYMDAKQQKGNCLVTSDGGVTWAAPRQAPRGYRSAVEYRDRNWVIATGPTGTDLSTNGGQTWDALADEGFHAVRKAKKGNQIYLAGGKGRIAVWRITQ
ncbi:oxidoreductase [Chitinophaga barathri]|uniref:Oxidoreductase n=1 Tax=Chitinophaga barathri TaxID=1647451 RepID=A0A3N4N6A7_9BACT|nr:oxidoreductase [Chitinophaga barathri]RPD43173.1 oxidoreductase [Chitinophaga barathri]